MVFYIICMVFHTINMVFLSYIWAQSRHGGEVVTASAQNPGLDIYGDMKGSMMQLTCTHLFVLHFTISTFTLHVSFRVCFHMAPGYLSFGPEHAKFVTSGQTNF